jgi:hypothetical protein
VRVYIFLNLRNDWESDDIFAMIWEEVRRVVQDPPVAKLNF